MKIKTNFKSIDNLLEEGLLENTYAVINYATNVIVKELNKLIEMGQLAKDEEFIEYIDNIMIFVNKENNGFKSFSTKHLNGKDYISIKKEKDCVLPDSHIVDTIRNVNFHIMTDEEMKKAIDSRMNEEQDEKFNEIDLEKMLIKDLSVIEEGITLIKNQYPVENGRIDILARDKNNKICIIELKKTKHDSKIIQQSVYYPTQFNEPTRMITIAPNYSKKITKSLKSLGYVEMKTYTLNENKLIISNF